MISTCSSSNQNPVSWKEVHNGLQSYWIRSPLKQRIFNPTLSLYSSEKYYKVIYNFK